MKRKLLLNLAKCTCAFFLIGGMMACSSDTLDEIIDSKEENKVEETVKPSDFRSINLTREMRDCNEKINAASEKLFVEALANTDGENVFLSPISINYVLATLANGADGDTKKELLEYLGVSDLETVNSLFKLYASELTSLDNQVAMNFGNSLWIEASYSLHPQFQQTLSQGWPVEVIPTEFASEQSRLDINAWVAKKTDNLIQEFLKEPLEGPIGIFNTVYFNGKWQNPFKASATTKESFNNAGEVDMMNGERGEYMYARGNNWQGVALPYGNGNYQMRLILPNEGVNLEDAEGYEDYSKWNDEQLVKVSIPKFECRYRNESFEGVLQSLGINTLFDDKKCDLSNLLLVDGILSVNKFIHEAVIKVDESGAEMAAASGAGTVGFDGPVEMKEIDLNFNRPFIFEVRESSTNTLIFIGAIRNL